MSEDRPCLPGAYAAHESGKVKVYFTYSGQIQKVHSITIVAAVALITALAEAIIIAAKVEGRS